MKRSQYSFADLRLICDYLYGLRNEIAVDVNAIEVAGLDPSRFGKIPRPARWIKQALRFPFLSVMLQWLAMPLWFLLGPVLFASQRRSFRRDTLEQATQALQFDAGGQVLGFSARAADIVHAGHISPLPRQWLELPWLPLDSLPEGAERIPLAAMLDASDLRRADALARRAHYAMQRRRGSAGWGLQTFTAWRWFVTRLAVDKLPGPLLTVEHFDRWAVLADCSAWAHRLRAPQRTLTLMQHGSVGADTPATPFSIQLPTRLRGVAHLHVYSAADEEVFRRHILALERLPQKPSATHFRPRMSLTRLGASAKASLLFVGHPLCEAAHRALMLRLQNLGPVEAFYKPHPTTGASKQIASLPWTIVQGRTVFPRVDLIVSYPSTMVAEYATHGIEAVVHAMDITPLEAEHLAPEIFRKLSEHHDNA